AILPPGFGPKSAFVAERSSMIIRRLLSLAVVALLTGSAASASDIRRVVTGLDADNKAVVLFDSRLPLRAGPYGLQSTNLWVTNSYPLDFSFKEDTAAIPVGNYPLNNVSKGPVVEYVEREMGTESKTDPDLLMKAGAPVA